MGGDGRGSKTSLTDAVARGRDGLASLHGVVARDGHGPAYVPVGDALRRHAPPTVDAEAETGPARGRAEGSRRRRLVRRPLAVGGPQDPQWRSVWPARTRHPFVCVGFVNDDCILCVCMSVGVSLSHV